MSIQLTVFEKETERQKALGCISLLLIFPSSESNFFPPIQSTYYNLCNNKL